MLVVSYTERSENWVRSARLASQRERRDYEPEA